QLDRLVHDAQRPQAEDVELDQAQGLDIVLVELADADAAGGVLDGHDVDQGLARYQHAPVVEAEVAGIAVELLAELDDGLELADAGRGRVPSSLFLVPGSWFLVPGS